MLLDQFFSASRLRDRTALQKIATVILEPLEQGTVTTFTITNVVDLEGPNGLVQSKQVNVWRRSASGWSNGAEDLERRPGAGRFRRRRRPASATTDDSATMPRSPNRRRS